MRTVRGTSEPPVNREDNGLFYDEKSGLRRSSQIKIKIAGLELGSQDSLNKAVDFPVFHWERLHFAAKDEESTTPFGRVTAASRNPTRSSSFRLQSRNRTSSVNNIVSAIEAESCQSSSKSLSRRADGLLSFSYCSNRSRENEYKSVFNQSDVRLFKPSEDLPLTPAGPNSYEESKVEKCNKIEQYFNTENNYIACNEPETIEVDPSEVRYHEGKEPTRLMTTDLVSEEILQQEEDFNAMHICNEADNFDFPASNGEELGDKLNTTATATTDDSIVSREEALVFEELFEKLVKNDDCSIILHNNGSLFTSSTVTTTSSVLTTATELAESNDLTKVTQQYTACNHLSTETNNSSEKDTFQESSRCVNDAWSATNRSYNSNNEYDESTATNSWNRNEKQFDTSNCKQEMNECESREAETSVCSESSLPESDTDSSSLHVKNSDKWRQKRRNRHRTIDYHDLSPVIFTYNGQVAKYVQRSYPQESQLTSKGNNSIEDGVGQGLGIILDKLRNIETKLDEIKTMEQSYGLWCPEVDTERSLPALGSTPTAAAAATEEEAKACEDDESKYSDVTLVINCEENPKVETECDVSWCDDELSECSDVTLIVNEAEAAAESEEPSAAIGLETTGDDLLLLLVNSPISPTVARTTDCSLEFLGEISSSEEEESRAERIERLARQMVTDMDKRSCDTKSSRRGLDTLSEQSEEEEESCRRRPPAAKTATKLRSRRTRSSSRDRTLAKIRYCWRCHQTGHESFDCEAQLHPGNWCPRCLENTHWEDDCWVNEKQVHCPVCTLPGHLPCVHETADFRQRKLVVETFGWLAFKDWFREPDFWSWWNVSGYTNVPLYKLMQHASQMS